MFGFIADLFKPKEPKAPPITSETSMNFDAGDIRPFLVGIANNPRFGLPDAFVPTIVQALPDLAVDVTRRWTIDGSFDGKIIQLEIEVFMDDLDAPDLSFFSTQAVIEEIDRELSDFAESKGI